MSEPTNNKLRLAMLTSAALNIFLAAFIMGRLSTPGLMPPPPFGEDGPPRPGMTDEVKGASGKFGKDMPPPPHRGFFSPRDLFTREEMEQDFQKMRGEFDKISGLRLEFAKQLSQAPLSKEEVLKHFSEVDQIMDGVKQQTKERAAQKISSMSAEERQNFATKLLEKEGKPRGKE